MKNRENSEECEKPSCCALSCCCHPCLEYPVPLYEVYDDCGPGYGLRGDVLYMNYSVPTLSFVARTAIAAGHEESHIFGPTAKANVGCDLALTYTMCNDPGYSFEAGWYHLVSHYSSSLAGNLTPAHIVAITTGAPGTATNTASLAINFWDLVMRKDYRWGEYFTIYPAGGVIGGFMHTKDKAHFTRTGGSWGANVVATDIQFDQFLKYEGIGVRLGTGFECKIWRSFKIIGNFYYNVLYGFSKDKLNVVANGTVLPLPGGGLSSATAHYFGHHGRSFFDSLVGLSWDMTWCKNAIWVDLHAGWKVQYFPAGWTQFEAELNNAVRELPLHGQGLQAGLSLKY